MIKNTGTQGALPFDKDYLPTTGKIPRLRANTPYQFSRQISLKVKSVDHKNVSEIQKNTGLSEALSTILSARGFKADAELNNFLNPSLTKLPHPKTMKGFNQAIELIVRHTKHSGTVALVCDFDADGTTAAVQMQRFFQLVEVKSEIFVPNRFTEGYGLIKRIIDQAHAKGFRLLITLDFGTFNSDEILYAQSKGMRIIVVDHHLAGEKVSCPADILINPGRSECGFAGNVLAATGLSWYLCSALRHHYIESKSSRPEETLDLATVGTIADMVPLRGASRILVHYGLKQLAHTKVPGLRALLELAGSAKPINVGLLGFRIGPMINAAGRLTDANTVLKCLSTDDSELAFSTAAKLNLTNRERQRIEQVVKFEAFKACQNRNLLRALTLANPAYHTGVIGIVAQRMVEEFYLPTALLGSDDGMLFKGSVRGVAGFHVRNALHNCRNLLLKYGGHPSAGGFQIESQNIDKFTIAFNAEAIRQLGNKPNIEMLEVDLVTNLNTVTSQFASELEKIEPCGVGNPRPVICFPDCTIKKVAKFKNDNLRVVLQDSTGVRTAILWRKDSHPLIRAGTRVKIAANIPLDEKSGEPQLTLRGIWSNS